MERKSPLSPPFPCSYGSNSRVWGGGVKHVTGNGLCWHLNGTVLSRRRGMLLQMANQWTEWIFQPDPWVLPFNTGSRFFLASFSYFPHLICPLVCDSWFWWKFNAKIKSILLQSSTSPLLFISLYLKNYSGICWSNLYWNSLRINHFHPQHKERSPQGKSEGWPGHYAVLRKLGRSTGMKRKI